MTLYWIAAFFVVVAFERTATHFMRKANAADQAVIEALKNLDDDDLLYLYSKRS